MPETGFIVHPTYHIEGDKATVYLFGRLSNGESFMTKNAFKPYFFIKKADVDRAKKLGEPFDIEEPQFHTFYREEVVKVVLDIPTRVPPLRKLFEKNNIACYEADIRFAYRFMMDHDVKGFVTIDGDYEKGENVDRIYTEPSLSNCDSADVKLKVLAFDLETSIKTNTIFSVSLVCGDYKKVLVISDNEVKGATIVKDEKELLEMFTKEVLSVDPDVITGWNVIGFDLNMLRARYGANRLPFLIGRIDWEVKLRIEGSFFRSSEATVPGRVVLDGIDLLKDNFIRLDDYKLDTAAQTILGEKKVEIDTQNKAQDIERMFREDKEKLVKYNLKDSLLVIDILEKKKLIELNMKRSSLTGMPLDRVSASIASLDSLYIRELAKQKVVAPTLSFKVKENPISGGFVMESKPGIYDYVIVCDFKSLYPSIIRTFNVDPYSHIENPVANADKEKIITCPDGTQFFNSEGILPSLIQRLWKQRDQAKKDKDDLRSLAIKILMNSFFGALASPNCRFFSMAMGNGITKTGQFVNKRTAEEIKKLGYEVIYSDTDSVFVNVKVDSAENAAKIGKEIETKMNTFWNSYITKNYARDSFLELEFEKTYKRFLMPTVRGSDVGSKKRYAGIILKDGEEKMDIVGLEFVRRDWTELARNFQYKLLELIFAKENPIEFIKQTVKDLKEGKLDDQVVYRKALSKNLSEYTKTTPPHVKAARKLDQIDSSVIRYVMTTDGPEPIQIQKHDIDYDHYLEKQLKPIADSILGFFNTTFDDLTADHNQKSLFDY